MSQITPQKPASTSSVSPTNPIQRHFPWLYAFWKFSRPHTVIGTSLSNLGLWIMALAESGWDNATATALNPLAFALLACLCGNIYIVGLNQLEDVAIDRVNKPHLPLASGEFSRRQGWAIVLLAGLLALAVSAWQSPFLTATVWSSLLIGTAYSLPPIRLKRFPAWAALCIFSVRGAIVNLGLFLHFNQQFGAVTQIPATVWALTIFILVFTFAIAIFKDIPDLEGDRRYHISTFTIRLGAEAVFKLARAVLTCCYIGLMLAVPILPVNPLLLIATQGTMLATLWWRSRQVNLEQKSEVARFYQFIWKLFFLEYLVFPIVCLVR